MVNCHRSFPRSESKTVLDSGFHAMDSRFQIVDFRAFVSGIWIPDSNRWRDSVSCIPDPKAQDSRFHKQKCSLHEAQLGKNIYCPNKVTRCSNSGIRKKIACSIRNPWLRNQGIPGCWSRIPEYKFHWQWIRNPVVPRIRNPPRFNAFIFAKFNKVEPLDNNSYHLNVLNWFCKNKSSDGLSSSISFANIFFHSDRSPSFDGLLTLITCKNSAERRFHTDFPLEYSVPIAPLPLPPQYYTAGPPRLEVRRRYRASERKSGCSVA